MEMNSIGSRDLSLTKYTLPTGEKRKVELTATSLFPEEEVRETEESQARYRKYEKIIRKMYSGRRLTAAEMRFLRQHYPEAAAKAERIQREIEMVEEQLRTCDTQEEAEQVYEQVRTQALARFAQKIPPGLLCWPPSSGCSPPAKLGRGRRAQSRRRATGRRSSPGSRSRHLISAF